MSRESVEQKNRKASERRPAAVRSATITALKLGLATGLVAYLIWRGDIAWGPLRASLARWQYSVPALLVLSSTPLMHLWRWQSLLRASRLHLPTREVFSYLMVAKFFNMALPGYIGGDVIRGFYVSRRASEGTAGTAAPAGTEAAQTIAGSTVVPSIVFDRMAGLLPLFALCLAGSLGAVYYSLPTRLLVAVSLVAGMGLLAALALFVLAYQRPEAPAFLRRSSEKIRLHRLLSALYQGAHLYVRNLRLIRNILGISFLSQGLIVSSFVLFGLALGLEIPLVSYLVLVPVGLMVTAIPIAPAGLGVGQVAFLALFRMGGTAQGANLFTLYMASCALINLSGAILFPFRMRTPLPPPASLAQEEKQ